MAEVVTKPGAPVIMIPLCCFRVVRDDRMIPAGFREPDKLQQAYRCDVGSDMTVIWRDVEVVGLSTVKP